MRKVFEMAGLRPPFLPFLNMEDPGLIRHIISHFECIILLVSPRVFLPLDLHDISTTCEERGDHMRRGGIYPLGGHRLQYGLPSHVEQSGFFARSACFNRFYNPSSNIGLVFCPLNFSWGTDSSTASYLRHVSSTSLIRILEMVPRSPIYHLGGFYGAA